MSQRFLSVVAVAVFALSPWSDALSQGVDEDIQGRDAAARAAVVPVVQTSVSPPVLIAADIDIDDRDNPGLRDQVIADDLIVQGSLCTGIDCINNESFGFDTLILKENNLQIFFDDTSALPGFAANDWRLIANDSGSGGASYFTIEDSTAATRPFMLRAGAPANALFIAPTGRIGLRTATPALDLHMATGDTPGVRLEQTNASGFSAQTWDVAGNEANFFVRDVTAGSRLPLRIRPGAPTSSLDIAGSGAVGLGTAAPTSRLDVSFNQDPAVAAVSMFRVTNPGYPEGETRTRFEIDSDGNVLARGAISQLSSRHAKHAFGVIDGDWLLARLRALPVTTWSYLTSEARHAGPVAEDFHAAFGLGTTDSMIAPSDLAGVALAAVKALQEEVDARDRRIETLERRLAEIEARLAR